MKRDKCSYCELKGLGKYKKAQYGNIEYKYRLCQYCHKIDFKFKTKEDKNTMPKWGYIMLKLHCNNCNQEWWYD